jgi:chloramphenicol O-acetyltransferase type A
MRASDLESWELARMPLSLQVHHGLMDGAHVGKLLLKVQAYVDDPDSTLGEA